MDVASYQPGCATRTTRFFTSGPHYPGHGFSLIEMMVSLAVLAILSAYAYPAFDSMLQRQRQATSINALISTLYHVRSEAIMRNRDVMVCKSRDGLDCTRSGEWEQGWLVFEDSNRNRVRDSNEGVISRQPALNKITIYYRAFGSDHYLIYTAAGITKTNGTYTFCDASGAVGARAVIVYKTGRPRTSATRSDGDPLRCPP